MTRKKTVEPEATEPDAWETPSDPAKEEPPAPAPEPQVDAVPQVSPPDRPLVPLRVFASVVGVRWDQMAGFVAYAKKQKLGPLTIEDWRVALTQFNAKPV
jgi:hypothetical protein